MGKHNNEIRIKLSQEEKEVIERKAELSGLSLSSFLRMLGLKSNVEITQNFS